MIVRKHRVLPRQQALLNHPRRHDVQTAMVNRVLPRRHQALLHLPRRLDVQAAMIVKHRVLPRQQALLHLFLGVQMMYGGSSSSTHAGPLASGF